MHAGGINSSYMWILILGDANSINTCIRIIYIYIYIYIIHLPKRCRIRLDIAIGYVYFLFFYSSLIHLDKKVNVM
jgi:hypothetical protein